MIYLISKQTSLFSERYSIITVEESFNIINNLGNIRGLDTETTGLNPHQKELLTVQIGNKENQVVIDCTTIDISLYSILPIRFIYSCTAPIHLNFLSFLTIRSL